MSQPNKLSDAKTKTKGGFFNKLLDKINAQVQGPDQSHNSGTKVVDSTPKTTTIDVRKQVSKKTAAPQQKSKPFQNKTKQGFFYVSTMRVKNASLDFFAGIIKEFSRIT